MENGLKEKYGLPTAIAMVVGTVVGSGVFFKAEKVLNATGGNLPLGILAWFIGGVIMVVCAYSFAQLATKYEYVNGLVDYAEVMVGEKYAYFVAWFNTVIYLPCITSVLAWVSARYIGVLFGFDITGGAVMTIACFLLVMSYALNTLSPVLAGKFQVSTTIIKLIPLYLMAIVGTVIGLKSGMTVENFTYAATHGVESTGSALFTAVCATAFAYDGWVVATSINAELKDAKKNLPIALTVGTLLVVATYILYYVGLAGAVSNETLMAGGEAGAKIAFQTIFSNIGGTLLFVFVVISCIGTLNGLMLACSRGFYSFASRGQGPSPKTFSQVDKATNMPTNSAIIGLAIAGAWLLYFYGANLTDSWFGFITFDSSELPIITQYLMYMPIFVMLIKKETHLNFFNRFIVPVLAIVGCLFMMLAACVSHGISVVAYLIVFAVIMLVAVPFSKKKDIK